MMIRLVAMVVALGLAPASPAGASPEFRLLYSFAGGRDGGQPMSGLVADSAGAFYGTTIAGGASGRGVVFKLTPPAAGQAAWTETVLHDFDADSDGVYPLGTLVIDASGALYGTANQGGLHGAAGYGYGTVFRLQDMGAKGWQYTTLHRFSAPVDGCAPTGVILDASGALYGVTRGGGIYGGGAAYELTPPSGGVGRWTQTILHSFGDVGDGRHPNGLVMGATGTLYGTTYDGGAVTLDPVGTLFSLVPPQPGQTAWTEKLIHDFRDDGGTYPDGGLTVDRSGRLYGTTTDNGKYNHGTVYRVDPPPSGTTKWRFITLYEFPGPADGLYPQTGVVRSPSGLLYLTTYDGGTGDGVLSRLAPPAAGQTGWTAKVLYDFGSGPYNLQPDLVMDRDDRLCSTLARGGATNHGVVYCLKP